MKRQLLICAATLSLILIGACSKKESSETSSATDPGQAAPVNAVQDAVGGVVGQTSAATLGAHTLQGFVSNAAVGDMYEIQAGQLAQQKANSSGVKSLAKMIITDHTASSNEMKPLAAAAGETPPTELDQRRKGFLDNLRAASATDFDKVFLDQQVAAHDEALTMLKGYADNGDNAGLKAFAAKTAPIVQKHLDEARRLRDALTSGNAQAK